VTEWTKKKDDIFDPPLIAPYLYVRVFVCVCVRVCVCACMSGCGVAWWGLLLAPVNETFPSLSYPPPPLHLSPLPFLPPAVLPPSSQKQRQKNGSARRLRSSVLDSLGRQQLLDTAVVKKTET
jgi:hypothetical protein